MAQKSEVKADQAKVMTEHKKIWWVTPALIGCCLLGIIFAYLHIKIGGMAVGQAAGIAAINIIIFLVSYIILKNIPHRHDSAFATMISSIIVSLPVFVLAYFGLAFEISIIADFTGMYILGTWIGSSEAAERA